MGSATGRDSLGIEQSAMLTRGTRAPGDCTVSPLGLAPESGEVEPLLSRLGAVRCEERILGAGIRGSRPIDRVARQVFLERRLVERIHLHGIEAEHLALESGRELGVAVFFAQLGG